MKNTDCHGQKHGRTRGRPKGPCCSVPGSASFSERGFVLIMVILAMAVIGIEMSIMGSIADTAQFQSHAAYLQACRRNLTASGLAWARQNIPNKAGESTPGAIRLDTGEMNIHGSELNLTINPSSDGQAEILIKTSCSRGRQTLKGQNRYKLSL